MTAGWNGAEPPEPAAWSLLDRLRLGLRAVTTILVTAVLFGVFLIARALDRLRGGGRMAPRVVQSWAVIAMALLGLRFRRIGTPMREAGAIVANHASWIDIVALSRADPVCFVSKSEVAGWPVIGFIGKSIGTEFIERRAVESRRQTEVLSARLRAGDRLCLFPEGTSTDGQRVLPFNSTLFQVFYPCDPDNPLWVQPVSVHYRPRRGLPPAFYGWWGDMDFATHLGAVLALSRGGRATVQFHPPLRVADYPDRKSLAAAAFRSVGQGFEAIRTPEESPAADTIGKINMIQ